MNTDNAHAALSDEVDAAFAGLATLPDQVNSTLLTQQSPSAPITAAGGVRWLTETVRERTHTLQFPFELDGVEYRTITAKRLSAGEVEVFLQKLREAPSGADQRLPMHFVGETEIADSIWDALDDDDIFALEKISLDLMPTRFRRAAI